MAHFGRDPAMAADARTNVRSSVNIPRRLRILIADDHEGFRNELQDTLTCEPDFRVVAAESNGADAVRRVRALRPYGLDLVLMDIDMPVMNGIEAVAEIAQTDPDLPLIILTVSTLDRELFAAMDSGAVGFLNKNLSLATLVRTLRDFHRNGSLPMSRIMAGKALAHLRQQATLATAQASPASSLSSREREVLRRIAGGAHDREIACALAVAETTVKTHVRNILRKLGVRNRAEAAAGWRTADSARLKHSQLLAAPSKGSSFAIGLHSGTDCDGYAYEPSAHVVTTRVVRL
jgi:two-component system nitrate/nitrite response regulator NarL